MRKKKIQIGEFVIVNNKSARAAANSTYMFGVVKEGGKEVQLMLTMAEYAKAMARAGRNPEDCIKRYRVIHKKPKRGFMAWLRGR